MHPIKRYTYLPMFTLCRHNTEVLLNALLMLLNDERVRIPHTCNLHSLVEGAPG